MNFKSLLLILIGLLFIGCNPTPTNKAFRHQTTPTKTEAILKLDTKGHTALIRDIIVTKSGDIISASDDKTIRVWDSKTGKEKRKILGQIGAGNEGVIYAIALSPNEEFLAIGGYLGKIKNLKTIGQIRIYNYSTGKLLKVLKSHIDTVNDLAFSKDGKYLISGSSDSTAKIWSVKDDFSLKDTIRFDDYILAVRIIKKGGEYLALTAGFNNHIFLYNINKRKSTKKKKFNYKLLYLATTSKEIALCGYGKEITIMDYNLNIKKNIHSEIAPSRLAYSPNNKYLIVGHASSPEQVNIYSLKENYKKITTFTKHKNLVMAVGFLNNKIAISAGGNNKEIYIWNIEDGNVLKKIEGMGDTVWSIGINRDKISWGNHLNYKSNNNRGAFEKYIDLKNFKINFIKGKKFKKVFTINKDYSLTHTKGGNYKLSDGVLLIKKRNKIIVKIIKGETNGFSHRCYGWYKDYIISGGSNGQLKIYNQQGREIASLVGHTGEIWSIALDGDRLISGSSDQTIKIWDLSKLKENNKNLNINERNLKVFMKSRNLSRDKVLKTAKTDNYVYNGIYMFPQIKPQLSLFISKTNDWIAWTPQGFYDSSERAEKYIGYHINHGSDHEAEFLDIRRFRKQFYRPDLIAKAINGEDISSYARGIDIDSLLKGGGGLPPKVKIENDSITTDQDSVDIGVTVCDMGGGFDNLNFYVDGKAISYLSQTKAFRHKKEQIKNCTIIEQSISVPSGKHTIGFDATNKDGNILSNTPTITVTNTQKAVTKPNMHLLTLSISDYQDDSLDLKYPNNDAKELTQKLKEIGKPIFSHVYSYALKDKEVTKEQIDRLITQIAPKVGVNDVFVLYISGHGITNDADGDYYFIPYNCPNGADVTKKAISQDRFKKIMSQIKAVKSVILLDTCESGSMASKELVNTSVNRFGGNVGSAIIAGATSKQNAIDGYKKHGIFTYTVLDAMSNKKVYDFEDKISIGDIAQYVKKVLPRIAKREFGHKQEPTIYMQGDTTFSLGGL